MASSISLSTLVEMCVTDGEWGFKALWAFKF